MQFKANEKGYALLTVLGLVLIFTVLGMALFSLNLNAAKQFNLKEEQVQARHQAEMGILHYQSILNKKVSTSSDKFNNCLFIENILGSTKELKNSNYKVIAGGAGNTFCTLNKDEMEIKIKSIGTIGTNTEKEVVATFYTKNNGGTDLKPEIIKPYLPIPPLDPTKVVKIFDELKCKKMSGNKCQYKTDKFVLLNNMNAKQDVYEMDDHVVVNEFRIDGGASDYFEVAKDFYVTNSFSVQNNACLAVGGDMTIIKQFELKTSAHIYINVHGNLFIPSGVKNQLTNKNFYLAYVGGDVYERVGVTNEYKLLDKSELGLSPTPLEMGCKVSEYDNPRYDIKVPEWEMLDERDVIYN